MSGGANDSRSQPFVGQTLPPSASINSPSVEIGARTLGIWIGGAAAVGLIVSVLGAIIFLPSDPDPLPAASAPQPKPSVTAPAKPPPAEESVASALSLPSLVERAEQGDKDAIEQIESRPPSERTMSEALAWARGKSERKRRVMASIAKQLRSDLPLSADRETLRRLEPFTRDPETATEALAILASLKTPMAADMLYDVWLRKREKSDATALAESLLYTKEVRDSASDALAVVLDLHAASTCEQIEGILERAREHGDSRAVPVLGKLNFRYGCGSRGGEDCYPCLRGKSGVSDAIRAARGRPAPEI